MVSKKSISDVCVYVCAYVCVYVCVHVCVCMCVYVYVYVFLFGMWGVYLVFGRCIFGIWECGLGIWQCVFGIEGYLVRWSVCNISIPHPSCVSVHVRCMGHMA